VLSPINRLNLNLVNFLWLQQVFHGREWTRLLRVLAVQCPLQTSPITQPPVRYIHTTVPHSSYTLGLHCAVRFLPNTTVKKVIHRPTGPITPNDISAYIPCTVNFYRLLFATYDKLDELAVSQCESAMYAQRASSDTLNFPRRLGKVAQTMDAYIHCVT